LSIRPQDQAYLACGAEPNFPRIPRGAIRLAIVNGVSRIRQLCVHHSISLLTECSFRPSGATMTSIIFACCSQTDADDFD